MFFTLKKCCFFDAFWDAFWMDFGGPDPRKWSSRFSETLILIKSPFSSQGGFLMQNGPKHGAKMEPKGHSKSMKKSDAFFDRKMHRFLVKNGALGEPKGTLQSRKSGDVLRLLSRTPPKMQNGVKMTPKWSRNRVKMEWKWHENGAKTKGKLSEHSSRTICVVWEFLQVSKRVFSWFIRAFLEFIWNFTETS